MLRDLFGNFGWVASPTPAAPRWPALLFLTVRQSGLGVLMAVVPIARHAADHAALLLPPAGGRRGQCAAAASRPPSARPHRRRATCRSSKPASGASTAPSRTPRSAWRWCPLDGQRPAGQPRAARAARRGRRARWSASRFRRCRRTTADAEALRRAARPRAAARGRGLQRSSCAAATATAATSGWRCTAASSPNPSAERALPDPAGAGHHRAAQRRGRPAPHRLPRQPDRPAQPPPLPRAPGAGDRARAQADPQRRFAVMFLDFDRFKLINDSLGHSAGDELPDAGGAAHPRAACARGDVVARLGGDEFAVLVRATWSASAHAVTLAERLHATRCGEPLQIGRHRDHHQRQHRHHLQQLRLPAARRRAARRRHRHVPAKAAGKARYALFDASLHTAGGRPRCAWKATCAVPSTTASCRWPTSRCSTWPPASSPASRRWRAGSTRRRALISPAVFIPIAEETGADRPAHRLRAATAPAASCKLWQRAATRRFAEPDDAASTSRATTSRTAPSSPRVTRALVDGAPAAAAS